jgi:hypothetical protein
VEDHEEFQRISAPFAERMVRAAWKVAFQRQKTRKQSLYMAKGGVKK